MQDEKFVEQSRPEVGYFHAGKASFMKRPDEKQLARQRSGHRERVRQRFIQSGLSALHPFEVLEYLLFFLIPRKDVKPIAKALLEKFKTVSGVLDASPEELNEFGLTSRMTADIAFLRELLTSYHFEKIKERPLFSNSEETVRYLQSKLGNNKKETLVVFFLDSGKSLLGLREFPGTVSKAPVAPREIAESALCFHASFVILAHNHPSGSCRPSASDVEFTRSIYNALELFEIKLLDHLIITRNGYASLMQ